MRPLALLFLLLVATLAFVLPATARPNEPDPASKHYRFSFHVTATPSSGGFKKKVQFTGAGSGSFALGRHLEHRGGTQTWTITSPRGSVRISFPQTGEALLQADVVGGTYATRKVAGGLERTARLKLFLWVAEFPCNFSSSTRGTLVLTQSPQRESSKDTVTIDVCPGQGLAWKGTQPAPTVRIAPA